MAFIIWLSVLGVVLLIALAPITLRAAFDGELLVRLRIYGIPYTIAPRKKRKRAKAAGRKSGKISKKAIKADKKRRKNDPLSISQMLKEDGVGAVLAYLKGMASLMNTLVRRILNAITVDRFHLSLTVAGGDAAETALLHAAACSIVFPTLSSMQYVLKIRRREVRIQPDFVNGENQASFDIRLRSCPARILWAGLRFLVAYIGNTIREREQEAQTEPPRPKAPAAK